MLTFFHLAIIKDGLRYGVGVLAGCCLHYSRPICTRQVTRATHVRNRVCPRVELILKIIIILLIIFLGFIKSKPC